MCEKENPNAIDYYTKCERCGQEVKGTSEEMVRENMGKHQASKECNKDRLNSAYHS